MHRIRLTTLIALTLSSSLMAIASAQTLTPASVAVGNNLQTYTTIALSEPARSDLQLTLTSSDPSVLLLSKTPDVAGSPSITITVRTRFRESPEFWVHGLAGKGEATYTVSGPGVETATGRVTLTPSGILMTGPYGAGVPAFATTPRAWPSKITLRSVRLDSGLKVVESQYVRGGHPLEVGIASSNPAVGTAASPVHIGAAGDTAITEFKPASVGETRLSLVLPPGFSPIADSGPLTATVKTPGIAVATDMAIGENLQAGAALSLGEPAPEGGVTVTLTSQDPEKLLLSTSPKEKGAASIKVKMAPGSVTTTYYLQALARTGSVMHTASAPGYSSRTGTLTLVPSGVIISLPAHGPPDEAELFRPDSAGSHQNLFVALLSERRDTPLVAYTAYMDPVTRRTADITVQPLRAGLTLRVNVENSDVSVGAVDPHVTIEGGSDRGTLAFKPFKAGQTVISVVTPPGFTKPSNATQLLAIVK
jgi:hypothetical protein